MSHTDSVCYTTKMKRMRGYKRAASANAQVFRGTIHFVQVNFGGVRLSDQDQAAAMQYAILAAPVLQTYTMQYGSVNLNIDSRVYQFTWPSPTYSDSDLQSMVATICKQYNFPIQDAVAFLSPPGATNTDAPNSSGILGYHNATSTYQAYLFVNIMGTGLTVDDKADAYAVALSHEIAEMAVDPLADLSNPEVCDSCAGNCSVDYRNYFDVNRLWLGGGGPPGQGSPATWSFYTDGVATPYAVKSCPAPAQACIYDPNSPPQPPPPAPGPGGCIEKVKQGVADWEVGNYVAGFWEILEGIQCIISNGFIVESGTPALDGQTIRAHIKGRSNP